MKHLIIVTLFVFIAGLGTAFHLHAQQSPTEVGIDGAAAMQRLLADREMYVQKLGAKHPTVTAIDKRIAVLESHADDATRVRFRLHKLRSNLDTASDKELRETIGFLLDRVVQLEKEVADLRRAEPRVELLNRDATDRRTTR